MSGLQATYYANQGPASVMPPVASNHPGYQAALQAGVPSTLATCIAPPVTLSVPTKSYTVISEPFVRRSIVESVSYTPVQSNYTFSQVTKPTVVQDTCPTACAAAPACAAPPCATLSSCCPGGNGATATYGATAYGATYGYAAAPGYSAFPASLWRTGL
jgi:hypothetical protein